MDNTITFEIPYNKHSMYANHLAEINNIISRDGVFFIFISNIPTHLQCFGVIEIDDDTKYNQIVKEIQKLNLPINTKKGIDNFFKELPKRRWDQLTFPVCSNEYFIYLYNNLFVFADDDTLYQKGYDFEYNSYRPKVFISYCHDDKDIVYKIVEKLENKGTNIWIDKKDIQSGKNLLRTIIEGINESECAVSFVSKSMINSNYAQAELNQILSFLINKKNKWCFIKLDDVNVDDVYPGLSSYAYIDFNTYQDDDMVIEDILKKIK